MSVDLDLIANREPTLDRWNRYMIPHGKGKKRAPKAHTRATTIAKGMADTYGLERWQQAQIANGLGRKPDLVQLAKAHPIYDEAKSVYHEIIEAAFEASDGAVGRRAGTALHKLTEGLDAGRLSIDHPSLTDDDRARLTAYRAELDRCGVEIDPKRIEQVLVCQTDGQLIAGTADRFVHLPDGRYVIADLKTGKSMDHGALEFAVQLAIYANHTGTYDVAKDRVGKRIEVDISHGLIIHLPSQGPPSCDLYLIDLILGRDALAIALQRRALQKAGKQALTPYQPVHVGSGGARAVRDWLAQRIQTVLAHPDPTAAMMLQQVWAMTPVPIPLPQDLDDEQAEQMDHVLYGVERQYELPFPPERPGTTNITLQTGV